MKYSPVSTSLSVIVILQVQVQRMLCLVNIMGEINKDKAAEDFKVETAREMLKSEIEVFEKLQNQISNIEQKLREAADHHDIRDNQLEEVDKLLTEVDREVLLPLGEKLVNFQTNIMDTRNTLPEIIKFKAILFLFLLIFLFFYLKT